MPNIFVSAYFDNVALSRNKNHGVVVQTLSSNLSNEASVTGSVRRKIGGGGVGGGEMAKEN
jgi:hypothetical protein